MKARQHDIFGLEERWRKERRGDESTGRAEGMKRGSRKQNKAARGRLTEADVLREKLCELVTLIFLVATVAAVAVGGDADFG